MIRLFWRSIARNAATAASSASGTVRAATPRTLRGRQPRAKDGAFFFVHVDAGVFNGQDTLIAHRIGADRDRSVARKCHGVRQ